MYDITKATTIYLKSFYNITKATNIYLRACIPVQKVLSFTVYYILIINGCISNDNRNLIPETITDQHISDSKHTFLSVNKKILIVRFYKIYTYNLILMIILQTITNIYISHISSLFKDCEQLEIIGNYINFYKNEKQKQKAPLIKQNNCSIQEILK